jgi:acetyl esterase
MDVPHPLTARQRAEFLAARAAVALPPRVKRRLAGAPIRRDGLELDLDTQLLLRLDERSGTAGLSTRSPAEARADTAHSSRVVAGPPVAMARVQGLTVAGGAGPLRARLYVPVEADGPAASALLVFFHGGGWSVGDLDTHDAPARLLAASSGARVLTVDFRLAPEHRFPAAVDDALAAFRDAHARAGELGADPARIAVGGDSAGGHLAAVTAQQAAADGGPAPAFQLLVYPVTDFVEESASRRMFAEGFFLTKVSMDFYEDAFLAPGAERDDPRVSPLRAGDLSAVAPALVVTAGFDPLRDEGEAYAERLRAAGVPVLLRRHPGFVHGFFNVLGVGHGPREAVAEMGGVLRAALAPAPPARARAAPDAAALARD